MCIRDRNVRNNFDASGEFVRRETERAWECHFDHVGSVTFLRRREFGYVLPVALVLKISTCPLKSNRSHAKISRAGIGSLPQLDCGRPVSYTHLTLPTSDLV